MKCVSFVKLVYNFLFGGRVMVLCGENNWSDLIVVFVNPL